MALKHTSAEAGLFSVHDRVGSIVSIWSYTTRSWTSPGGLCGQSGVRTDCGALDRKPRDLQGFEGSGFAAPIPPPFPNGLSRRPASFASRLRRPFHSLDPFSRDVPQLSEWLGAAA